MPKWHFIAVFWGDLNLSKLEWLNSCFTAHVCSLFRPLQTPLNMPVMGRICPLSASLSWVVTVRIGFDSWKEPEQKQRERCPMSSIYQTLFRDGSSPNYGVASKWLGLPPWKDKANPAQTQSKCARIYIIKCHFSLRFTDCSSSISDWAPTGGWFLPGFRLWSRRARSDFCCRNPACAVWLSSPLLLCRLFELPSQGL